MEHPKHLFIPYPNPDSFRACVRCGLSRENPIHVFVGPKSNVDKSFPKPLDKP